MSNFTDDIRYNDTQAFKKLFWDYYPVLCVFAQQFISDAELCKDIAQEALLTYWERRKNFSNIYQTKSFLYTVAKNKCFNILRHNQFIDSQAEINEEINVDEAVEDEIIRQETFLMVRQAVAALPPQMQRIIRLSMKGKKNPEIAQLLSISEGTVHSLKKTAYQKLREMLNDRFVFVFFMPL